MWLVVASILSVALVVGIVMLARWLANWYADL
jgi:hypothetical protein